jgi:hypothetical protein
MMSFLPIHTGNIDLLSSFLKDIGSSSSSFRYYSKRNPLDAIANHLSTLLLCVNELPVAYGHLDKDGENVWLGICVKESEVGKGYGKMMMKALTSSHDGDIVLSVDRNNDTAISLYLRFGFVVYDSTDKLFYMRRSHDSHL